MNWDLAQLRRLLANLHAHESARCDGALDEHRAIAFCMCEIAVLYRQVKGEQLRITYTNPEEVA